MRAQVVFLGWFLEYLRMFFSSFLVTLVSCLICKRSVTTQAITQGVNLKFLKCQDYKVLINQNCFVSVVVVSPW